MHPKYKKITRELRKEKYGEEHSCILLEKPFGDFCKAVRMPKTDVENALEDLEKMGKIKCEYYANGKKFAFRLTYQGAHPIYFWLERKFNYWKEHWIAFLALILAAISLGIDLAQWLNGTW